MGFWDTIKKAAGKVAQAVGRTYVAADKALGGYLPGGKTPAQVKTSKTTTKEVPRASSFAEKAAKKPITSTAKEEAAKGYKKFEESRKSNKSSSRKSSSSQTVRTAPSPQLVEEKPSGWSNVADVMLSSVNPFDQKDIIATTDNRVFNSVIEYVANNPYAAALMLTPAVTLAKMGISAITAGVATRAAIGQMPILELTGAPASAIRAIPVVANTVTAKASVGMLAKIALQMKKPAFVVSSIAAMLGTYPWAEWALGEAKEGMIFNTGKAIATGDPDVIMEYQRQSAEIFDITLWEQIQRLIPGVNIAFAFGQKAKSLMAQRQVNDKILQDEYVAITEGGEAGGTTTSDERWAKIRQEEADQDKATIDYYNDERKKMLKWEQEAYAAAAATKRANEIKARNEDAAFWAAQAAKQRELEAADRKAIADFWAAYRKTMQKISEDNRPSNLNFGLL